MAGGPDQVSDYVGADQPRDHLNRPDIVERAIILASAEAAVHEAQGTTFTLADLLARPVPRFKILSPDADAVQRPGRRQNCHGGHADPIKAIRVQVNGREIGDVTPDIGSGGTMATSLPWPGDALRNELQNSGGSCCRRTLHR